MAAVGMRRALRDGRGSRWAPRLLTITGAGLIGGGIFHPDPSGGFPPGTPSGAGAVSSWHGVLHLISGSAAFVGLIAVCVAMALRLAADGHRRAAACSWIIAGLCTAGVVTAGVPHGSVTLFIGVSIAMLWLAYISIRLGARHGIDEHGMQSALGGGV